MVIVVPTIISVIVVPVYILLQIIIKVIVIPVTVAIFLLYFEVENIVGSSLVEL